MKGNKWTDKEMQYLEKYWGIATIDTISKKLNRTRGAIKTKVKRMGIGHMQDNVDGIPMSMLGELVGKPYNTIRGTWINAGLKTCNCGKHTTYIKEKDLYKFMQEHPNLWDARECDYYMFYGEKWFLEALENERNGIHAKRYHKWSEMEKARLLYLRDVKRFTFVEIGKEFGLDRRAISGEYKRLKRK